MSRPVAEVEDLSVVVEGVHVAHALDALLRVPGAEPYGESGAKVPATDRDAVEAFSRIIQMYSYRRSEDVKGVRRLHALIPVDVLALHDQPYRPRVARVARAIQSKPNKG